MKQAAAYPNHNAHQQDDSALIQTYVSGDERAFEELINRHRPKIMSTIMNIVKDREVAEDLFQEATIKIVDVLKQGRYDEKGKFLPWALRVARNLAIDQFRKEKRNPQISAGDNIQMLENLYSSGDRREREIIRSENTRMVREMIRELPAKQREVLIMRHYNGLSFKEIAELTDVSINTALGRMRYALVNLRKIADKKGYSL